MKQHITITLDSDLVEKLQKEKNYSNIINELIKKNYSDSPHMQEANIQERLKELNTEQKEILKKNVNFIELSKKLLPKKIQSLHSNSQISSVDFAENP